MELRGGKNIIHKGNILQSGTPSPQHQQWPLDDELPQAWMLISISAFLTSAFETLPCPEPSLSYITHYTSLYWIEYSFSCQAIRTVASIDVDAVHQVTQLNPNTYGCIELKRPKNICIFIGQCNEVSEFNWRASVWC